MSIEVKIPAVGESISSGIVSVWHKKSGEHVTAGEALFTLETDKVSTEIVAESGGLLETLAAEGQEVKIGEVVATIDETAKASEGGATVATPESAKEKPDPNREEAPVSGEKKSVNAEVLSPAVRRIVSEEHLDPAGLSGTGKGGRLVKADVMAAAERQKSGPPEPARPATQLAAANGAEAETQPQAQDGRFTRKKMSPLRRKIAQQLVMAQHTAAILTTFNECDMAAVQELRKNAQEAFTKKNDLKLGFMSFFIKAAVEGLKVVPSINARIEGDDFIQNHFYDIGVAVGTERGLVVPVIREADKKSFADLERDIAGYAVKAREGKIKIEELQGGTFTISNGGVYGSLLSTPILNPPQSGILGMHSIQQRPMAIGGQVAIRPMMYLALSYDHRAVDGKEAVTFLIRVKECIEDPTKLPLDF
ncbi:MAG: 2-oxoglutarate dehydrogenase complex dihydrolipoyllysine-residue succinyltransferase [Chthoniobacterales bacterium]|jgi:2-oxoglutarate dehydrogenase E2 component (dihydrolipoamide succinyltransferase)|nr:2-oxoglutarate dehydrogenase complex dihydrolipoyllysine-residue succinyltransferase [Chthoniobacterales bacterium]